MVVVLGATVAAAGFAIGERASTDVAPMATLSMSATQDRIELRHEGGDALETERLDLLISVNGESLTHQPEIPFFSQRGFAPGPTGPINSASDSTWTVGEQASLRVAGSNEPTIESGDTVEVRVVVDETEIATLSTTARGGDTE